MACYCSVLGCQNNNHNKECNKHFFRFPKKDPRRHKLWSKFTKRIKNLKPTNVICSDHFEEKFMIQKDKKVKLTKEAVPTIYFNSQRDGLVEKVLVPFDGQNYNGPLANEMDHASELDINAEKEDIKSIDLKYDDLSMRCRFCTDSKDIIEMSSFAAYNIDIDSFLTMLGLSTLDTAWNFSSVCEECFNQVILIDIFVTKCKNAEIWFNEEIKKSKYLEEELITEMLDTDYEPETEHIEIDSIDSDNNTNTLDPTIIESIEETNPAVIIQPVNSINYSITFINNHDDIEEPLNSLQEQPTKVIGEHKTKFSKDVIRDVELNKFAIKSYECKFCKNIFAGLRTFKKHCCELKAQQRYLPVNDQTKNYCPMCKTVITGSSTLFKRHRNKCNRERHDSIECEICHKMFNKLHSYTVHKMFHKAKFNSENPENGNLKKQINNKKKVGVVCHICGNCYTTMGDCRRHIKLKHTEIFELYTCDMCQKQYISKSILNDHIRNTHVVNEVSCTYCGKIFRNKTHLKKHERYHDESKKIHKCLICPDRPGFINKVGLMRHQVRHIGSGKQFQCEICLEQYLTNSQLKNHMQNLHGINQ